MVVVDNPGIGKVTFAKNLTEWEMVSSTYIDYLITCRWYLKEITKQFTELTGRYPLMSKKLLGSWQK